MEDESMGTILRGVVVWVCIIIVEVLHGVARTMLLAPVVGDFRARQIAVLTGSFLVVLVATSFIGWLRPASPREAACVGIVWLALTLTFEIVFGRFVVHASWSRIAADYIVCRHPRRQTMALGILGAVVAALVVLFLVPGSTPRIDTRRHPHSLAVLERVPVNDTQQWVLIRSEDVANPVVLFVHGGPGTSWLTLMRRNTQPLERYFTVVNWDQRRAAKSFAAGSDDARMTMGQFVDDIVDLSSYLAKRFDKTKILLVGHSWGSVIGLLASSRRPDLFSAYIGIGQMSRMAESELISYEWTLEQAKKATDQSSVKKLAAIGPPPYTGSHWRSKFLTARRILGKHGGEYYGSKSGAFGVVLKNLVFSPEYTMLDRINFFRGVFQSVNALYPELSRTDLFIEVPEVKIPVYFCLGRHDYEVPSVLSAEYFEVLKAPRKHLVWFESSAHLPNTEEKDKFNEFMIHTVRPALPESTG